MAKHRNIVLCIVFSFITCGIYGIYWFVKITNETNALATEGQTAGGGAAFLLTIITLGIYGFYWAYKMGQKVDSMNGNPNGSSGILYLILDFIGLGIVVYCLAQNAINKKG